MFTYENVYKVINGDIEKEISSSDEEFLLIPDLIDDIIKKINSFEVAVPYSDFSNNGIFQNGYAIIYDSEGIKEIIREDGSTINDIPNKIKCVGTRFLDDRLLIRTEQNFASNYGYIDGITGKILMLPQAYQNAWAEDYSNGYTVIQDGSYAYINKDFQIVSPEKYIAASYFIHGKSLVATDKKWKIINTEFKTLLSFDRDTESDEFFNEIVKRIDIFVKNNIKKSNIRTEKSRSRMKYFDKKTGFSIFTPFIIKMVAAQLNLEVPNIDIKEQLVWLVDEASKLGTYTCNIKTGVLTKVKVRKGIKISDGNQSMVSYDEKDVAMLRERKKTEDN